MIYFVIGLGQVNVDGINLKAHLKCLKKIVIPEQVAQNGPTSNKCMLVGAYGMHVSGNRNSDNLEHTIDSKILANVEIIDMDL